MMADAVKQKYYQEHKDARLAYQRAYYTKNKDLIKRRLELRKAGDPKWEDNRKEYNRSYYRKNRSKIREKRALLREKRAKDRSQNT